MALRSRSRTATPTSGPGRGPGSDGRTRHLPHHAPGHAPHHAPGRTRPHARPHARRHHRTPAADALRLRAEALFAEGAGERRESGNDPPGPDRHGARPRASTATGRGTSGFRAIGSGEPGGSGGSGGSGDSAEPVVREAADPASPAAPAAGGSIGATARGTRGGLRGGRERWGPAIRERMPLWLQSRCGLERKSVAALSVLLVVAAVLAAQHFWAGRTRQVRAPEVVRAAAPYGAPGANRAESSAEPGAQAGAQPGDGTGTGGQGSGPGSGPGTGPQVVVDVSGRVRRPGLLRLPAGARVADALRAAGGVRPGTATDGLNRARLLMDGEQIVVGAPAPAAGGNGMGPAAGGAAADAVPAAPVSLSTATVDQLDALPGVGPVLARHIVDYRSRHGGFRSVDELRDIDGIGERRFADLRNRVRP